MFQLFGRDSARYSLQNPLKSLHRRAIKIVLLKRTSRTDRLPQNGSNSPAIFKARFVNKIVSGRVPIYLSTKLLLNQSSRNSPRKLNVPLQRIDLFRKSILIYSGPAPLWNLLPSELRLPVSPSVFKKRLTLHMFSLLGVT